MTTPGDLSDRYGTPSPARRRATLAGAVTVAVVLLAWLAWAAWSHATPQVTSELLAWEVVDDTTVSTRVAVDRHDDDVTATCTLRAYGEDHASVGDLAFTVAPEDPDRSDRVVRTVYRATSVELLGCTTPDQDRAR